MIYIVASTFYEELSNELIKGAVDRIRRIGDDNIIEQVEGLWATKYTLDQLKPKIVKVPGAFEIPGMVKQILDNKQPGIIITLGVIIKGETNHFEQISEFVFSSISKLTISSNVPIAFGVISAQNYEQAEERALTSRKNKGFEVASTGLEMLKLYEQYNK